MLFIGCTMNKETQESKKSGRKKEKNRAVHCVAHIICGISRSSHNPCVKVCVQEHFPTGRALSPVRPAADDTDAASAPALVLGAGVTVQYSYSGI